MGKFLDFVQDDKRKLSVEQKIQAVDAWLSLNVSGLFAARKNAAPPAEDAWSKFVRELRGEKAAQKPKEWSLDDDLFTKEQK